MQWVNTHKRTDASRSCREQQHHLPCKIEYKASKWTGPCRSHKKYFLSQDMKKILEGESNADSTPGCQKGF